MFSRQQTLVVGSSRIAKTIAAELRRANRPAWRMNNIQECGSRLRHARVLVLADPAANPNVLIRTIAGMCRRRAPRQPPLRLILIRCGDAPPSTPAAPQETGLSIEVFDPEAEAARALIARWPPHAGMDPPYGQTPHILFAGFAAPASALLVQTLRLIHYGDARPVISIAEADPEARRNRVLADYPQAEQFCRLRFTHIEDTDLSSTPPVTGAFVCTVSAQQGLATARKLIAKIARIQGASPPIHLEVGDTAPAGGPGDWDGQIFPFSWLHQACRPDILLDGHGDELARVVHEHYRDSIAAQGREPDAEPAGQPWETLSGSYRNASRHQADHLSAKLATLDCRAVREELVESFTFAPLEAERLAVIEHQRWAADRYLDGWAYAPERDNARKHHPQLIPYADLSEPMKDLDRFAVRLAPALLARSGRGLVRMLLVALVEPREDCRADRHLIRLAEQALRRLVARYPDRSLVLASTLESSATRLVVRQALDEFETALFLLCPKPLADTLGAQSGERERRDILDLAARAERRVALTEDAGLENWFAQRTEIRLLLGTEAIAGIPAKQVRLDPGKARPDWNFEY